MLGIMRRCVGKEERQEFYFAWARRLEGSSDNTGNGEGKSTNADGVGPCSVLSGCWGWEASRGSVGGVLSRNTSGEGGKSNGDESDLHFD